MTKTNILSGLAEEKAIIVAQKWKANFIALSRSFMAQTLVVNELLDMEWRFGGTYIYILHGLSFSGHTKIQLLGVGTSKARILCEQLLIRLYSHSINKRAQEIRKYIFTVEIST